MKGKYDSFRDAALHFLCTNDWANESFGDVNDYGVYIWRISNSPEDVQESNTEINAILGDWAAENADIMGDKTTQEVRDSLIGHFIVSENTQGQVTVRKYSEVGMLDMFHKFQNDYNEWNNED